MSTPGVITTIAETARKGTRCIGHIIPSRRPASGLSGSQSSEGGVFAPPSITIPRLLTLQLFQLTLPPLVLGGLLYEPCAEHAQSGDEGVELVQRVRTRLFEVEIEVEVHALVAIRDLESQPRLEVVRAVRAVVLAVRLAPRATVTRVLDVCDHVRAAVEAG